MPAAFLDGSIVCVASLEMLRDVLLNAVQEYSRLATGLPESTAEHHRTLVEAMERDLLSRPEWQAEQERLKEEESGVSAVAADAGGSSSRGEDHTDL